MKLKKSKTKNYVCNQFNGSNIIFGVSFNLAEHQVADIFERI